MYSATIKSWLSQYRHWVLLGIAISAILGIFSLGPIPQHPEYNHFANEASWLGIPYAHDVLSNLPFLLIGLWGMFRINHFTILGKIEKLCWFGFFLGVALTALGSGYYHLEPDNWRLIWDRVPIVIAFMCLFSAVIADKISPKLATISLLPLILYSLGSIFYWYYTESLGQSDLRPYILVQAIPLLLIPFMLWLYPSRYTKSGMLLLVAGWYILAKVGEGLDSTIFNLNGIISGHTLKHIFAAMGCVQVAWMLETRTHPKQ